MKVQSGFKINTGPVLMCIYIQFSWIQFQGLNPGPVPAR